MEKKLVTVRRRMLRYVFRIHRHPEEDWVPFVQRAAGRVDYIAKQSGLKDWVIMYRRRKWRFAGELACRADNRWSKQVLGWLPNHGHGRLQGRPKTRWMDQLEGFAGGDWVCIAQDIDAWDFFEGFISS